MFNIDNGFVSHYPSPFDANNNKLCFKGSRFVLTGKVVFRSFKDHEVQIYRMDADGSRLKKLIGDKGEKSDPIWSPDGTRILFQSSFQEKDSGIYIMNADGGRVTRLTAGNDKAGCPSWSPDGSKIAFLSKRNDNEELWIMNTDGSDQKLVTKGRMGGIPVWSPDGTRLAISFDENTTADSEFGNYQLYTIYLNGTGLTPITNNNDFGSGSINPNYQVWSRDGQSIFYSVSQYYGKENQIRRTNTDGSPPLILINNINEVTPSDFHPQQLSPDGTKIVYAALNEDKYGYDSYVKNMDGTNKLKLTKAGGYNPIWSPDGNKIMFLSNRTGNCEIYAINHDGSYETQLTSNIGSVSALCWSAY